MLNQAIKASNTKDETHEECKHLSKTGNYCIKCGTICYKKVKKIYII